MTKAEKKRLEKEARLASEKADRAWDNFVKKDKKKFETYRANYSELNLTAPQLVATAFEAFCEEEKVEGGNVTFLSDTEILVTLGTKEYKVTVVPSTIKRTL